LWADISLAQHLAFGKEGSAAPRGEPPVRRELSAVLHKARVTATALFYTILVL